MHLQVYSDLMVVLKINLIKDEEGIIKDLLQEMLPDTGEVQHLEYDGTKLKFALSR